MNITCAAEGGSGSVEMQVFTHMQGVSPMLQQPITFRDLLEPAHVNLTVCMHPTQPYTLFINIRVQQLGAAPDLSLNQPHFQVDLPLLEVHVVPRDPLPPWIPALGWPLSTGFHAITPDMPPPLTVRTTVYQAGLECFHAKASVDRGCRGLFCVRQGATLPPVLFVYVPHLAPLHTVLVHGAGTAHATLLVHLAVWLPSRHYVCAGSAGLIRQRLFS